MPERDASYIRTDAHTFTVAALLHIALIVSKPALSMANEYIRLFTLEA